MFLLFSYLINKKIVKKVDRFSKYLILQFKDDTICMIHLGMSGTLHLINYKKNEKIIINIFHYTFCIMISY